MINIKNTKIFLKNNNFKYRELKNECLLVKLNNNEVVVISKYCWEFKVFLKYKNWKQKIHNLFIVNAKNGNKSSLSLKIFLLLNRKK